MKHLSLDELYAGLPLIEQSPQNAGIVKAIVIRPQKNERMSLTECQVSPEWGVHGDRWIKGSSSMPNQPPNLNCQVSIMNARAIALLAQDESRWALAGDNFYLDLDLSRENLICGQRLDIGTAILEITDHPHNGCKKFAERYGTDAVAFVNSEAGKALHLRGIYAKVIQSGTIKVGDHVAKM